MTKLFASLVVLILATVAKVTSGQEKQATAAPLDFFQTNNLPLPNNMEFTELQTMVAPGLQQSLQVAIDAYTANMPAGRMNQMVGTSTLLQDLCAQVVDIQSIDVYVIQLGCGAGARRHLVQLPEQVLDEIRYRGLQDVDEIIAFLLSLTDQLLQAFCCFCFLFEVSSPSECICECISNPLTVPIDAPVMLPPSSPQPTPQPTTMAPSSEPTFRPTPEPTPAPVTPFPTLFPTTRPTPRTSLFLFCFVFFILF